MQEKALRIIKYFYGANVISALLMACMLDSDTVLPAVVMLLNLVILITPIVIYEVRNK